MTRTVMTCSLAEWHAPGPQSLAPRPTGQSVDFHAIKEAAFGRVAEIIEALTCLSSATVTKTKDDHPCPQCGGASVIWPADDATITGRVACRKCTDDRPTGDIIATVAAFGGRTMKEAAVAIADYLGIDGYESKLPPLQTDIFERVGRRKKVEPSMLRVFGGVPGNRRPKSGQSSEPTARIPMYGPDQNKCSYQDVFASGEKLNQAKKSKGMFFPRRFPKPGERWAICEGVFDAAAVGSLAVDACGTSGKDMPAEFAALFAGVNVVVVPDLDLIGMKGANRTAARLAGIASSVRIARPPGEIKQSDGDGPREVIAKHGERGLLAAIDSAAEWVPSGNGDSAGDDDAPVTLDSLLDDLDPLEEPDDPARLARINVARYESDHGGRLAYWQDRWWKYQSFRWRRVNEREMKAKVRIGIDTELSNIAVAVNAVNEHEAEARGKEVSKEFKKPKITTHLVNNVIAAMESKCFLSAKITMPCWLPTPQTHRNLLPVANGILDLDAIIRGDAITSALLPSSPEWFSTTAVDYPIDIETASPSFDRYLESSLPDEDARKLVQEFAGYLFFNGNPFQRFLVLEGDGGSGKSVLTAVFTALLGIDNVSNVDLEGFGRNQFSLVDTIGKALNVDSDVSKDAKFNEGLFKKFASGERIQVERKGEDAFVFKPTAKSLLVWNERPRIRDRSSGLWRRMLLVSFDRVVPEGEKIRGMDEPEFWTRSGELPGILRWAVEGLRRLFDQQAFTIPKSMTSMVEDYRRDLDPVASFMADVVAYDAEAAVCRSTASIVAAFRSWCIDNATEEDAEKMNNKSMGRAIAKSYGIVSEQWWEGPPAERSRVRGFRGITLNDVDERRPAQLPIEYEA